MSSYQYRKSHCGDKTILRPSYLHNGNSYTGEMSSLHWIRAQHICKRSHWQTEWDQSWLQADWVWAYPATLAPCYSGERATATEQRQLIEGYLTYWSAVVFQYKDRVSKFPHKRIRKLTKHGILYCNLHHGTCKMIPKIIRQKSEIVLEYYCHWGQRDRYAEDDKTYTFYLGHFHLA